MGYNVYNESGESTPDPDYGKMQMLNIKPDTSTPRNFDDKSILEFKRELENRLNLSFRNIGTGHPELSGVSFTHTYHPSLEYTDVFDLILYLYEILQNNDQLVNDLESARYFVGTGENREF